MSWLAVPFATSLGPGSAVLASKAGAPKGDKTKADDDDFDGVVAGGLIVQAADTGRVLMIQRTPDKHDDDAAYSRWEWPGGCLDVDDEGVWQGALREWEEETGAALGDDAEHAGSFLSHDGRYQSYVIRIPSEASLELDPQPEEVSQAGWWDPVDLTSGPVRDKVIENLDLLQRFLIGEATKGEAATDPGFEPAAHAPVAASSRDARKSKAARLGSYHRHTDRIVEHYQPQVAQALEDMFPQNVLEEAIQQVKDRYPDAGRVEKADSGVARGFEPTPSHLVSPFDITEHPNVSGPEGRRSADREVYVGGTTPDPVGRLRSGEYTESAEKALVPAFVSTAVAALRARLSPSKRLAGVLSSLYSDAALQASRAATEAVGATVGDLGPLMQDLPADYWSNWTPGWADAASQLEGGGLQSLLDSADVTIRSIEDSRIGELGDAIARGVEAGDSVDQIARDCRALLIAPSRAFLIADTEVARAMSVQTLSDYRRTGVEQVEWLAEADACEECEALADGSPYPADSLPDSIPQHPRCRCAWAPVVDTSEGSS